MTPKNIPPGLKLLQTLSGHTDIIYGLAWSPDGKMLASSSADETICLWNADSGKLLRRLEYNSSVLDVTWSPDGQTVASGSSDKNICLWNAASGNLLRTLKGHGSNVYSVAWSPDGQTVASGSDDKTICLWNAASGKLLRTLKGHTRWVIPVSWSPDGQTLASGSGDNTLCLWNAASGKLLRTLKGHGNSVYSVMWSPDGQTLASCSYDKTIRLWKTESGKLLRTLEGHTRYVNSVRFSADGRLLASTSGDDTVRLWRCDTWETVLTLAEPNSDWEAEVAFHPHAPLLATQDGKNHVIHIWHLDYAFLLGDSAPADNCHYRNAKVVLVGDTGVGKSGLGLVLTGQEWQATESTHGRYVWTFASYKEPLPQGRQELREILLWDLAGQAGYRLIHQLHLNEVAVALVIFDARSETEPFSGVRHWDRALRQALRIQGDAAFPLKKYLVAARADRGGIAVSRERLAATVQELGYDGFIETSAKEGWQISELIETIQTSIDWEDLPKVSSNELFQTIKQFLIDEKEAGRLLSMADDLYRLFCQTHLDYGSDTDLRAKFDTCIGRVESRGLIRRLSFGDYVLLQPELLDAYSSAIVNAAKSEPRRSGLYRGGRCFALSFQDVAR